MAAAGGALLRQGTPTVNHVQPRVIPVLLLDEGRLVKTERFSDPVFVGDPLNVISMFNELEVDELALLDIGRARSRQPLDLDLLTRLATECFVPLAYGGGIRTLEEAALVIEAGFEKVVLSSALVTDPREVERMVAALGAQAVVAALDVGRQGEIEQAMISGGTTETSLSVEQWCALAETIGVGEVVVTSIAREGTRSGYDLDLIGTVASRMSVPVVANGGAGSTADLAEAISVGASSVAAGSLFVFQSGRESVLVNYPSRQAIDGLFAARPGPVSLGRQPNGAVGPGLLAANPDFGPKGRMCPRCLITEDVPNAHLSEGAECFYCGLHDQLGSQYPTGAEGERRLNAFCEKLRTAGRKSQYDCILGVSGGCDSSYLVNLLVERGVRPLAVHFDNTWNSPTATSNIHSVLGALDVPLKTYVVDNDEYDDIYRAFMLAGVKDVEAPTDIGFMGVLYRAAEQHGIRHIVEGHSFRTEGVSPLGWLYMDGGYVRSVHERYGSVPMRTYPNMEFGQFVRWAALSGIERSRPLYHLDYVKEDAKLFLADAYGWQWYGGHHLENRFTAFYHTYFLPTRFGIDFRQIEFSALVRSGQMDRERAISLLSQERVADPELLSLVKKRLGFTDAEFEAVMTAPHHSYLEFDTYKARFQRLRPFFWAMYKLGRVPESFYVKFCT